MLRQTTLRQGRVLAQRRFASSESTAKKVIESGAEKTKSATDSAASSLKSAVDSQPVNSAVDTAKEYADKAAAMANNAFNAVGGRASGALGGEHLFHLRESLPSCAQTCCPIAYREPIFHNLAVAREVGKQVYIAEGLAPPTSFGQVTSAWQTLYQRAVDPSWWRSALESGEWKRYAVYAVEAYGIFKIGEMLGRRSLVCIISTQRVRVLT